MRHKYKPRQKQTHHTHTHTHTHGFQKSKSVQWKHRSVVNSILGTEENHCPSLVIQSCPLVVCLCVCVRFSLFSPSVCLLQLVASLQVSMEAATGKLKNTTNYLIIMRFKVIITRYKVIIMRFKVILTRYKVIIMRFKVILTRYKVIIMRF